MPNIQKAGKFPVKLKRAATKDAAAGKLHAAGPKRRHFVVRDKAKSTAHKTQLGLMPALIDPNGRVRIEVVADWFGMSKGQIAETAGVKPSAVQKKERLYAPKPQNQMREMLEIVGRVTDWAGGEMQAMAWYRSEPIPAFGGRTAEALVKDGKATSLRDYLDSIALGGFA
jgi:hypothetical protein